MLKKYYQETTNLKEIIKLEEINNELTNSLTKLKSTIEINKKSLFLDLSVLILGVILTILTINLYIPLSLLMGAISIFSLYSYFQDKNNDKCLNKEMVYLENLQKQNSEELEKLKREDIPTNNYVVDEEIDFTKKDKERFLLELEKKLLLIRFFNKHQNKLSQLELNNTLEDYLKRKNYSNEDISFIKELMVNNNNQVRKLEKNFDK